MSELSDSVQNLQAMLERYTGYDGPGMVDDAVSDEFIAQLNGFISGIADIGDLQDIDFQTFSPEDFETVLTYIQSFSRETERQSVLQINAGLPAFEQDPTLFRDLIYRDLDNIVRDINTLANEGIELRLDAEMPEPQTAPANTQPAATATANPHPSAAGAGAGAGAQAQPQPPEDISLTSLETHILTLSNTLIETFDENINALQERINAAEQDADTSALQAEIDALTERRDAIQDGITPLQRRGNGPEWDETSDMALAALISELQSGGFNLNFGEDQDVNLYDAIRTQSDQNIIHTSWLRGAEGEYSEAYHNHLRAQLGLIVGQLEELEAFDTNGNLILDVPDEVTEEQAAQYAQLSTMYQMLNPLVASIDALEAEGQFNFADNPPPGLYEVQGLSVIDYPDALALIDTALQSEYMSGQHYFETNFDDGVFDIGSRRATQVLILSIAEDLGLDIRQPRLSPEFRAQLANALEDEENVVLLANTYFDGDTEAVSGYLIRALNTLAVQSPNILPEEQPQQIGPQNLIYRPEFNEAETHRLDAALNNVESAELSAINQLAITMTGFGFEQLMPESTLSAEQIADMTELDRDAAFSTLFTSVYEEELAALGISDPSVLTEEQAEELAEGITIRLGERFNNVFDNIDAFDSGHRIFLKEDMRQAVQGAITTLQNQDGDLDAATNSFASNIPSHNDFIAENGVGRRSPGLVQRLEQQAENAARAEPLPATEEPDMNAQAPAYGVGQEPLATTDITFIIDPLPGNGNVTEPLPGTEAIYPLPGDDSTLPSGVYVRGRYSDTLMNIEASDEEIANIQETLGINLQDLYEAQYMTPDTSSRYHQDIGRFFVLAIHPEYEELDSGFVIGYADDEGQIQWGYLRNDEFQANHMTLPQQLGVQFLRPDADGYDRIETHGRISQDIISGPHVTSMDDDNHIIRHFMHGALVYPDGRLSETLRLDHLGTQINLSDWEGDNRYGPIDQRIHPSEREGSIYAPREEDAQPEEVQEETMFPAPVDTFRANADDLTGRDHEDFAHGNQGPAGPIVRPT